MADIKSLAVRGIRSFGPDETDEQRISFEKPLTLILGQNGCGKTTIIECLRYAITGQMPPGSRNECFVHDAKISRSTEVLGQVKLKLMNAKNKQLEVSRSMKVTSLAKKKTKFQTLDSFLSVIDEVGQVKDISSRCADLDFVMYEELGVPKAILNSVIFCHQEDSSWPLDEGKKVKDRFDEIFDADKYSDCFERLRKMRKDYIQNLKLLELEVTHLTEKKQEVDKKKLEMVDTETRISESELKVAELTTELKPISEKLTAIETLQKNLVQWESKREKIKTKLEHNKTLEEDLKKTIKNIFEGPIEELQSTIKNSDATAKANQKELNESYKKNNGFNKEEEKIANEKTANEMKYNKLIFLESQNQERIDKRNKCIVETAKMAGLETPESIETNEDAEKGVADLTGKVKDLRGELKELKEAAEAEEKKYQSVVDESRDVLSRHRQKITSKEMEIATARKDILKLEKQITDATESKSRLELLEQRLNDAEEEYKQADAELNQEECQQEINDDEKQLEQHETDRDEIADKITKLQKQSAKLKERDLQEDTMKQKEKQLSVLQNKHRAALVDILGEMPESGFAMLVNKFEVKVKAEVDAIKKKLKANDKEMTKLETERKHVRELLTERREELTKAEDKMFKACGTQTYEETLSKVSEKLSEWQEEHSALNASAQLLSKYKNQVKDNNCCPLCNRGFEGETEVSDMVDHLSTQIMNLPSKLEKAAEELSRAQAKKDELLSLKTLNEKITSLKETDIPKLEQRQSDVDKKIADLQVTIEELQQSMKDPESKLAAAKQIQGEMPLLDRSVQELKTATRDFESIKSKCEGLIMDMSLEEATGKQTELKSKITTLKAKIKAAQAKLNQQSKKMRQMADKKNKIKEELLNIQKKVQEIVNLQENKKQIEENRSRFVEELEQLRAGTEPLEQTVRQHDDEKNNIVNKNRSAIELKNSYIQNIANSFDKVKSIDNEIRQHKERNIPLEMEKIKEANEKLVEKHHQLISDRNALTKRIDTLKDDLKNQEINKRDLEDNLKLRKAQAEIETCVKEEAEVNEKLSGVNAESLQEKGPLITQQTALFREKAQLEGVMKELQERLRILKADLKKAQNKDIEKKFREKFYELQVTKAIDKDINNYAVALEKCLMEFHREKMEHINLVIREMWRKIYRGNDIDYIEIKTEGTVTTESDRRKYDYRVVQCKNGVEIDMRGRCSAGQKVLACLIIRLALAETFSSRFGILALDEPTTNLDQENVRSLCAALGEIVQERMRQKNFMFIIITHDKEFIESLGNIDKVSHYYEVSRNDDGKSRIKKIRFS